jgi:hypothetical protein
MRRLGEVVGSGSGEVDSAEGFERGPKARLEKLGELTGPGLVVLVCLNIPTWQQNGVNLIAHTKSSLPLTASSAVLSAAAAAFRAPHPLY